MEVNDNVQQRPDVAADKDAARALAMQILKLRWMGMDIEAERMELALRRIDPECTVLAGPFDTD